jgi:hypothetical protein
MALIHRSDFLFTMIAIGGLVIVGVMVGATTFAQRRKFEQAA